MSIWGDFLSHTHKHNKRPQYFNVLMLCESIPIYAFMDIVSIYRNNVLLLSRSVYPLPDCSSTAVYYISKCISQSPVKFQYTMNLSVI